MLQTEGLPAAERFERFRAFFDRLFDVSPTSNIEEFDRAYNRTWAVEGLVFGHTICGAMRTRTPPGHRSVLNDYIAIRSYERGRMLGAAAEQRVDMSSSALHIVDLAELRGVHGAIETRAVIVPRSAVQGLLARGQSYRGIDVATPIGRLLAATIASVFEQLPKATSRDAARMASSMLGLLQAASSLGAPSEEAAAHASRARALAMRRYVRAHLADRNLGTAAITRAFGSSRSSVYRAFADVGGVQRYIADLRLDRAKQELMRLPRRRGAVAGVAERWALGDHSHFTRRFRRRFGLAPSDVVGVLDEGADPVASSTGSAAALDERSRVAELYLR